MPFIEAGQLAVKEPRPGWLGRFFHSEHMTFAYYEIQPGAWVHLHHHANEEVWHVLDGEVEMVVGDDRRVVHAGEAVVVPAGVEHSASASQRCHAIVVDFPARAEVGGVDIR
jgi:mannose-6-phosphate isomerase-like protein (cupin superfamily)